MYTLLYLTTFIAMSYCYERWMRIWFIRTMLGDESTRSEAIAQEQRLQAIREQELLQLKHDVEQSNRQREHETKMLLSTKEKTLMRTIMGNVVSTVDCGTHVADPAFKQSPLQ
jgi:hypothetical protein